MANKNFKEKYYLTIIIPRLHSYVYNFTNKIFKLLPIIIIAFIIQFIEQFSIPTVKNLSIYLACILIANIIQAAIVLPLILKYKGLWNKNILKNIFPALNTAFWAKSSSIALPVAIKCSKDLKISKNVANFSFPLCITINMNACAAFILITSLFITTSYGAHYSIGQYFLWIFVTTLLAIGNAGIPMGCYSMTATLLAFMNVPLGILGLILPFYSLIDMLESAINVWSDTCVTLLVDNEVTEKREYSPAISELN